MHATLRRLAAVLAGSSLLATAAPAQGPHAARAAAGAADALAAGRLNGLFDASRLRAGELQVQPSQAPKPRKGRSTLPAAEAPAVDQRTIAARLHQQLVVPVPKETPAYRHTFQVLLSQPDKTDRYDELIIKYARKYNLDARFLKSIMAAESEFDPKAVSPAGARGLMQVMPVTAQGVGVSPSRLNDPEAGIKAGAAYFQDLFRMAWKIFHLRGVRYTDVPYWVMQRVIAAYHAGPKFLKTSRWFTATRAYVRKVVLFYHSKVTDLRRGVATAAAHAEPAPFAAAFSGQAPSSGTLY